MGSSHTTPSSTTLAPRILHPPIGVNASVRHHLFLALIQTESNSTDPTAPLPPSLLNAMPDIQILEDKAKYVGVNDADSRGLTPLHHAARWGHVSLAEYLLRHGASLSSKTSDDGDTPLHLAATYGHKELVRVLVSTKGLSVSYACCLGSRITVICLLRKRGVGVNPTR